MSEYTNIEHYANHVISEITVRDVEQVSERLRALGWEKIVRCCDCKHSYLFDMSWKSPKTNDIRYCGHGTYCQYEVPDDGFCAWGERKEDEQISEREGQAR